MLGHRIAWGPVSTGSSAGVSACGVCILKEFLDVPRHGNVEGLRNVIPFQFDAAIKITQPVLGDAIFFFNAVDEVSCVFFSDIFYPKIVDH